MTQKQFQRQLLMGAALLAGAATVAIPGQAQQQSAPTAAAPAQAPAAQTPAQAPGAPAPSLTAPEAVAPSLAAAKQDAVDASAYPVAEIIVRINDQIISKQDLERQTQQLMEQAKEENWSAEEIEKRKAALLSDLIDQQLLLSRGKELGISGDDELIRRLDETRKQNHLDSMEDLEKAVRAQGISFEDFKANMRNSIITQQVVRDEVGKTIHMTQSEATAYYQAHKDQFTQPESVHLGEILLPSGTTDAELAAAKARADKIEEELSKGASFTDLAKSVSTGPTASSGGDLGVFKRGQLAKELEDSTFSLKTGEITQPIRTRQGYVILKVLGHTPEGLQPYKDVEEIVAQDAYMERMQPALRAYLTKLREESDIDVKRGYVDVNASPNESKPVFSAYTPPQKKAKRAKVNKQRFRDKSQIATNQPPPPKPPDADDTVTAAAKKTAPGGPTTVATDAYVKTAQQEAANPTPVAAATPPTEPMAAPKNSASSSSKSTKRVKVRYGQSQQAAQLPPDPHAAAGDSEPVGDPKTAQETAAAAGQPSDASVEAKLTPESQQILGTAPEAPQQKTRMQQKPVVPKKQKQAAAVAAKNSNKPAPPGAEEVADQAVNSAPLGLNGDTASKQKAAKTAGGEKQRIQDKPTDSAKSSTPAKPNPGTPGADTATTPATTTETSTPAPAKKRHKLLGVL